MRAGKWFLDTSSRWAIEYSCAPCRAWRARLAVLFLVLAGAAAVRAASGTWINQNGGSWTNASNWSGGTIADGSGSSANFGTLNLTADAIVTLDVPRTVGSLV